MRIIRLALFSLLILPALGHGDELNQRQVELLAASCANCHGTDGRKAGAVPPLAGRPADTLEAQLLGFKHDPDTHATVMDRIAQGYTDEQLAALAEHFANLTAEDE